MLREEIKNLIKQQGVIISNSNKEDEEPNM